MPSCCECSLHVAVHAGLMMDWQMRAVVYVASKKSWRLRIAVEIEEIAEIATNIRVGGGREILN